jgi:sulfate/thiosulfate-binding protein
MAFFHGIFRWPSEAALARPLQIAFQLENRRRKQSAPFLEVKARMRQDPMPKISCYRDFKLAFFPFRLSLAQRTMPLARFAVALILMTAAVIGCGGDKIGNGDKYTLLNVSYDPTREFYQEFNESFAEMWKHKAGQTVVVDQSHGGSGKQARSVIEGQEADVVTLALAHDIEAIVSKAKLIPADWQSKLPHNSAPYTSTIVFLVRKGNPKSIKDWNDLARDDVDVITPNPKTGGGARWNYLAAWGYALRKELGDLSKLKDSNFDASEAQNKAREFVRKLYSRVTILDPSARAATNTFVQREQGDVLITWENEAYLALREAADSGLEIITPSLSILAEPPVAVVEKNAEKHGTLPIATAYVEHLFSVEGQTLAAKHFYRPAKPEGVDKTLLEKFQKIELFTIDDVFGGWPKAQKEHFDDGGFFDEMVINK